MKRKLVRWVFNLFQKRQHRIIHDAAGNTYGETWSPITYYDSRMYLSLYVVLFGIAFVNVITPKATQYCTIMRAKGTIYELEKKKK